jgi:hypothetical protein
MVRDQHVQSPAPAQPAAVEPQGQSFLQIPDGWPGFSHAQHCALKFLLWQLLQAVDGFQHWPLQKTSPLAQEHPHVLVNVWPPAQVVKHAAVPPVGVHVENPVLQTQVQVVVSICEFAGQLETHVPLQAVKPVLHLQWVLASPPLQTNVEFAGQVVLATHVPLQAVNPLLQRQWALTSPVPQVNVEFAGHVFATHVPLQFVNPVLHTQVQVVVLRVAFDPQFATQVPLHEVKPLACAPRRV